MGILNLETRPEPRRDSYRPRNANRARSLDRQDYEETIDLCERAIGPEPENDVDLAAMKRPRR